MGFETFRVELRGKTATHARTDETVRQLPRVKADHDSLPTRGSTFDTVEDGDNVIEVEVASSPVRVSCRFTLSHPPAVDSAFLDLVRELMIRLEMDARICDDVDPLAARGFPVERFAEFVDAVSRCLVARRAEWIANFGPLELPARTPQVYEKIILPRCVPVVDWCKPARRTHPRAGSIHA